MMPDPGLLPQQWSQAPLLGGGGLTGGLLGCLGRRRGGQPPERDTDGQEPVLAGFAALEGWSMQKSDGALGAVGV